MSVVEHQKRWVDAVNRGDVSEADAVFAPDCVIHITGVADAIVGVAAWKTFAQAILTAFPDIHFTVEEQVVNGNLVATRWTARGTHTGPFGPLPPTGRSISIDGLLMDRFENGRVVERWEQYDQPVMLQQLGVQ
jgi:steroid delta-isomerase-like uncharacterized protein